jgi:hypothetical protein
MIKYLCVLAFFAKGYDNANKALDRCIEEHRFEAGPFPASSSTATASSPQQLTTFSDLDVIQGSPLYIAGSLKPRNIKWCHDPVSGTLS